MDRVSVRALATAIRLIREPVVVTYSYPRSHPLYGAGEECGVFVPMAEWRAWESSPTGSGVKGVPPIGSGPRLPDTTREDI